MIAGLIVVAVSFVLLSFSMWLLWNERYERPQNMGRENEEDQHE